MLKKTNALGGLVIAATAGGILLTGSPASAAVPTWHHGRWGGFHATHVRLHNRNVNLNRNHNRVIVAVRVRNVNHNVAVARNGRFRRNGFFGGNCCRRGFLGDGFFGDGFDGDGFGRFGRFDRFDGGPTAIIGRGGGVFARG